MTIQPSRRAALIVAAALVTASVMGFAGTTPSFAGAIDTRAGSTEIAAAGLPGDSTSVATDRSFDAAQGTTTDASGQTAPGDQSADAVSETRPTASVSATSNDDSSGWDKASIIGKIFIACGTLLTLGSAARMFMI